MANENYYKGEGNQSNDTSRGSQLLFNLIGAQPTMVEYVIDKKTAEKVLKDIASDALNVEGDPVNNIVSAKFVLLNSNDYTYDERSKHNSYKPKVSAQVIIPARNQNIVSPENNEFIHSEDTVRYSDRFKQFVNNYCNDDQKTLYLTRPKRDGGISYRAIIIDIPKFFGRIFDYNGYAYKEANGKNTHVDFVDLQAEVVYEYNNSRRPTDIVAFKIRKAFQNMNAEKNLVFDVFDTRKKHRFDDDENRDNGRRVDEKDVRKDYRK